MARSQEKQKNLLARVFELHAGIQLEALESGRDKVTFEIFMKLNKRESK